jgi:hypothetical protein
LTPLTRRSVPCTFNVERRRRSQTHIGVENDESETVPLHFSGHFMRLIDMRADQNSRFGDATQGEEFNEDAWENRG